MRCDEKSNQRGCNIGRPDSPTLTDPTTMAISERTVMQVIPMYVSIQNILLQTLLKGCGDKILVCLF